MWVSASVENDGHSSPVVLVLYVTLFNSKVKRVIGDFLGGQVPDRSRGIPQRKERAVDCNPHCLRTHAHSHNCSNQSLSLTKKISLVIYYL